MKVHKVIGRSVTLNAGKVGLTEQQAKSRAACIRKAGREDGVYEIIKPVEFKCGEVFEFDGDVPKHAAADLSGDEASDEEKGEARTHVTRRRGRTPRGQ